MCTRNILFVAYSFPPAGGAAVQRSSKFVKYLPDFGYKPLVLTAGEEAIAPPLDQSLLDELDSVAVYRCSGHEHMIKRFSQASKLGRIVDLFLRPDIGVAWLSSARQMAAAVAARHEIHAVYVTVPPVSSILLGPKLKKDFKVPLIVDYRDPWTTGFRSWPTRIHYQWESRQERLVLEAADAIVVVTPTMEERLAEKYPQFANKMHLIYNGFDQPLPASSCAAERDALQIGFAGTLLDHNLGERCRGWFVKAWSSLFSHRVDPPDFSTHSPLYLLQALCALLNEHPEYERSIRLVFAGRFGDENLKLISEYGLSEVVSVKGYLPHVESRRLLMESDVLFLPMRSEPRGQRSYNLSGKVFEYLAAGKPILGAVPEGDARDLIERARAGWCIGPRDVEAIKLTLKWLVEEKLAGALKIDLDGEFVRRFERRVLTEQLASVLDSVVLRSPGRS